jgi:hypothetical protein
LCLGTATNTVQDQVIRYNLNTAIYNRAYINKQVLFDILSAVLEQSSADSVLCMLTYISLIKNPCIPIYIPDDVLAVLLPNPDITALEQEQEKLKAGVYRIQETDIKTEVQCLTTAISSTKGRHCNIVSEEY